MFRYVYFQFFVARLAYSLPGLRYMSARDINTDVFLPNGTAFSLNNGTVSSLNQLSPGPGPGRVLGEVDTDDGALYDNTTPDGGGSYSLVFVYGGTTINITIEACVLFSHKHFGIWTGLDNVTDDTANIGNIKSDAASYSTQYGGYAEAMEQSTINNCAAGLEELDQWMYQNVCDNSTTSVSLPANVDPSSADPSLTLHNELRRLLADELPEVVVSNPGAVQNAIDRPPSPLRTSLKYFGFLITAAVLSGIIVGSVTSAVFPNDTFTQAFVSGVFPAAIVLLSGTLTWISTRQLRKDVRVLVAAAAAAKMRKQAKAALASAGARASTAVRRRVSGIASTGMSVISGQTQARSAANAAANTAANSAANSVIEDPLGGGEFCVDGDTSFNQVLDSIGHLTDTDLQGLQMQSFASSTVDLLAAEQGAESSAKC